MEVELSQFREDVAGLCAEFEAIMAETMLVRLPLLGQPNNNTHGRGREQTTTRRQTKEVDGTAEAVAVRNKLLNMQARFREHLAAISTRLDLLTKAMQTSEPNGPGRADYETASKEDFHNNGGANVEAQPTTALVQPLQAGVSNTSSGAQHVVFATTAKEPKPAGTNMTSPSAKQYSDKPGAAVEPSRETIATTDATLSGPAPAQGTQKPLPSSR